VSVPPTVLVVEDDADVRDVVLLVLNLNGFDARGAADGAEAWQRLSDGLRPNVVLLDLRMPNMDGADLARRIQGHGELHATPLVVMSGEIHGRQEAADLGVHAFLEKPVGMHDLLETIRRSLPRPATGAT